MKYGGERGIRTLDTLLTYTHFPGVRLQPLSHLSGNLLQPIRLRARILAKISASARVLFGGVGGVSSAPSMALTLRAPSAVQNAPSIL